MATKALAIDRAELMLALSRTLGRNVTELERAEGGRNSQVYKVSCEGSGRYAVKLYYNHPEDHRDRLESEFSSLNFLWENGVRCIPRPIIADRERSCAVYEYIEGEKISSQEVSESDIDQAVEFLTLLRGLGNAKNSGDLPSASEACFSPQAIVSNIQQRLHQLSAVTRSGLHYNHLHAFLVKEFVPALNDITVWSESQIRQSGMSFAFEIPPEERTLSPSDFGFHNALRLDDGRIVFLDFEHFGWDDPAKLISDFLLHPAMELREQLKRRFVAATLARFGNRSQLEKRVAAVYPLFGLKWCLILLNEFVPKDLLRRGFASVADLDAGQVQAKQLAKARLMLRRTINDHEHFPYHV